VRFLRPTRHLDPAANLSGEGCITTQDSRVSVWVMPTNEEKMIALHTLETLKTGVYTNVNERKNARYPVP